MKHLGRVAALVAVWAGAATPGAQAQSLVSPGWSRVELERPFPPGCPPPGWEWYPSFPYGWSLAGLGDLDGDGRPELAVGDEVDDLGGFWVVTPNGDGTVAAASFVGGWCEPFGSAQPSGRWFGSAIAPLGDVDGDGLPELLVTAPADATAGAALFVFSIDRGLQPVSFRVYDEDTPGLSAPLAHPGRFGTAAAALGDLDGDGLPEVAVGAPHLSSSGESQDAVWILSLGPDDVVVRAQIAPGSGGLAAPPEADAWFGFSLAALGDLDGDGVTDLAVGAPRAGETTLDPFGVTHDPGEVWILFLQPDGAVKAHARIDPADAGPHGPLGSAGHFGVSLAALDDQDGDGFPEIAVGNRSFVDAWAIDSLYPMQGSTSILGLDPDGAVMSERTLANHMLEPGTPFFGVLGDQVALLGDSDGDGVDELAVVSLTHGDKDIGIVRRPWLVPLHATEIAPPQFVPGPRRFGASAVALPDLGGDGIGDVAVGAPWDGTHGLRKGSVTLQHLDPVGVVLAASVIDAPALLPFVTLQNTDEFGSALAAGDLDGDGALELLVGAAGAGGTADRGALFVLALVPGDTLASAQRIDSAHPALAGQLDEGDRFGSSVAVLPDLDGNGFPEIAVGAPHDDDGGADRGAVWILFLGPQATVLSAAKIGATAGGFGGPLDDGDQFGGALAALGDLDGDGVPDLAAGANGDDDGGNGRGALWLLGLQPDGSVRSSSKISATSGRFDGVLDESDQFGSSLALLPDLDGDGRRELAVGAQRDDDGGTNVGAVWVLSLDGELSVRHAWKLGAQTEPALAVSLAEGGLLGSAVAGRDVLGLGPELFAGIAAHDTAVHVSLRAGQWESVGPGLPGRSGVPQLSGQGLLVEGTPVSLQLVRAAPASAVALVVGDAAVFAPLAGGVLVPAPDLVLSGGLTDATGALHVQQHWPPGVLPGTTIWVQAWIADPGAPAGLAASNGIAATAP